MIDVEKDAEELLKAVKALSAARAKCEASCERRRLAVEGVRQATAERRAAGRALRALISGGTSAPRKYKKKSSAEGLNLSQAALVQRLLFGSDKPALAVADIAAALKLTSQQVSNTLSVLRGGGMVDAIGGGFWKLTPKGRDCYRASTDGLRH